jgi:membrane protease YdiL (CAAX protease family)
MFYRNTIPANMLVVIILVLLTIGFILVSPLRSRVLPGIIKKKDDAVGSRKREKYHRPLVMLTLCLIMLAEVLLFSGRMEYAVWVHVLVLIGLEVAIIQLNESEVYQTLQAMMLLPLLRLVNIFMPVFFEMTLYSFIFIYAPLIIPVYLVAVHQKFTAAQLGLIKGNLKLIIPFSIILGLAIAEVEYYIIKPGYLIPDLSLWSVLELSIVMLLFIGLVEELIFRSIVQTRLEGTFGMFYGLMVTSVMFGFMHSGYGTAYEMLFISMVGLAIGYLFQVTRSLPLIALTHGFVNVFLFGFIPHLGPGLGLF